MKVTVIVKYLTDCSISAFTNLDSLCNKIHSQTLLLKRSFEFEFLLEG